MRYRSERNLDLVRRIGEIAREKPCTPAQLALAWVLAQGEDVVPMPGTKHRTYLEENVGAVDVELTPGPPAADRRRGAEGRDGRGRYPGESMAAVNA